MYALNRRKKKQKKPSFWYILCMLMPQIIPLPTFALVHTWYEESTHGAKSLPKN